VPANDKKKTKESRNISELTVGQRAADWLTKWAGSWWFILGLLVILLLILLVF